VRALTGSQVDGGAGAVRKRATAVLLVDVLCFWCTQGQGRRGKHGLQGGAAGSECAQGPGAASGEGGRAGRAGTRAAEGRDGGARQGDAMQHGDGLGDGGCAGTRGGKHEAERCKTRVMRAGFIGYVGS
jgi:hypothetical protein